MKTIQIHDSYIKLGQALKLSGLVSSGIEAKILVQDGKVEVNGETDTRRGRKLYPGDVLNIMDRRFLLQENRIYGN